MEPHKKGKSISSSSSLPSSDDVDFADDDFALMNSLKRSFAFCDKSNSDVKDGCGKGKGKKANIEVKPFDVEGSDVEALPSIAVLSFSRVGVGV